VAARRPIAGLAVLVAVVALASACGGGSGSADTAKAKAEIKKNWVAFFDGSTPAPRRVVLLEHGRQFVSLIRTLSASPLARQVKATVSSVELTDEHTAAVTYTLLFGGQPVLKNNEGTAVLANGTWTVGVESFCKLLALQGATPKACAAPAK
jgi:hypothetical protein